MVVVVTGHGERIVVQGLEVNGLRHGHGPALLSQGGHDRGEVEAVDEHKIGLLQAGQLVRGHGERMGIVFTGQEAMHGDGRRGKGARQVA